MTPVSRTEHLYADAIEAEMRSPEVGHATAESGEFDGVLPGAKPRSATRGQGHVALPLAFPVSHFGGSDSVSDMLGPLSGVPHSLSDMPEALSDKPRSLSGMASSRHGVPKVVKGEGLIRKTRNSTLTSPRQAYARIGEPNEEGE